MRPAAALIVWMLTVAPAAPRAQMGAVNTVRQFILNAYQIQDGQLVGGPSWIDTERITLHLHLDGPPTPQGIRQAVRASLAERYKLQTHNETREMPVYALTPAQPNGQPGRGLKPAGDCGGPPASGFPDQSAPPPCGTVRLGDGQLAARAATLSAFAAMVNSVQSITGLDRLVVDRSGLTGEYAFLLRFAPAGQPGASRPDFVTALRNECELTLQPQQAEVPVVVIDSIERPDAN